MGTPPPTPSSSAKDGSGDLEVGDEAFVGRVAVVGAQDGRRVQGGQYLGGAARLGVVLGVPGGLGPRQQFAPLPGHAEGLAEQCLGGRGPEGYYDARVELSELGEQYGAGEEGNGV